MVNRAHLHRNIINNCIKSKYSKIVTNRLVISVIIVVTEMGDFGTKWKNARHSKISSRRTTTVDIV